jgi:FtsH-binding integral membrane protein
MNNTVSTGVFDRKGEGSLSAHAFYVAMTLSLLWGLGLTAVVAHQSILQGFVPSVASIILLGLVVPIIGIVISVKSDNPIISFIGYNMIVVPFGVILGPTVNHYSPDVVRDAFMMTGGITLLMGGAAVCFPSAFKNLGTPLFFALFGLVIVRILQIFIPALAGLTWIDYVAAGIFSLYIGYDMYRASVVEKTVDNAVDISIELYLDIINLFLTILRILGAKKD